MSKLKYGLVNTGRVDYTKKNGVNVFTAINGDCFFHSLFQFCKFNAAYDQNG